MVAGRCNLIIEQGEDWTIQAQFLDDTDTARPLVNPARMDIKDTVGSTVHSLVTDDNPPPNTIPGLVVSRDVGLIQAHIPATVTNNIPAGSYHYDLFITTDDGGVYVGTQIGRVMYGTVTVNKRITESF